MLAAGRIQWLGSAADAGWRPDSWLRLWARRGSPLPLGHIDVRMSDNAWDSVRKKVRAIFTELAGDRARMPEGDTFPAGITSTITAALSGSGASEEQVLHADQIAFHLTDWSSDAAFIVALHLFPERFTAEEIDAAVHLFLVHVPAHVMAAARLAGHPAGDDFSAGDDTGAELP